MEDSVGWDGTPGVARWDSTALHPNYAPPPLQTAWNEYDELVYVVWLFPKRAWAITGLVAELTVCLSVCCFRCNAACNAWK